MEFPFNSFQRLSVGLIFLKCFGQRVFGPDWALLTGNGVGAGDVIYPRTIFQTWGHKNTSLHIFKIFFPQDSQKGDGIIHMVLDSGQGEERECVLYAFHIYHC